MLGFKDYRNRQTEAMSVAVPPDEDVHAPQSGKPPVPKVTPDDVLAHAKNNNVELQVNKLVDDWVADLKRTLMNPLTAPGQQRGLWDRFKNGMSNMWHGRYNQKNPYFWQNKLGDDLGSTSEAFNPNQFSLSEYMSLRTICDALEEAINEQAPTGTENLRIVRLIDTKAQELKAKLTSILSNQQPSAMPPVAPAPAPGLDVPDGEDEGPSPPSISAKSDKDHKMIKHIAQQLLSLGLVTGEQHRRWMDMLSSDKQTDHVAVGRAVQDAWDKHINDARKKPADPAATPAADPVVPPVSDPGADKHALRPDQPPTTGKKWRELDDAEQQAWNRYGGGLEDSPGKIDGCLNDHGIKKLPWILRIGDPRRQILADQEQGLLGRGDGSCKKKYSHWHRQFAAQGRFEDKDSPIATWGELERRTLKIKKAVEDARTFAKSKRTTAPSDEDALRDREAGAEKVDPVKPELKPEPPAPELKPELKPEPPAPELKPEPPKPDLKDRKAAIDPDEIKDRLIHTPDNALDKPAHRTAGMDDAPPPPEGATPEAAPKTVRSFKAELKARIGKLNDEEVREQLSKHVQKERTLEGLEALEAELKKHEELETNDADFAWTLPDITNFYKLKLRERKEEPKPLVDRSKVDILPFNERVEYYRELARQRS